MRLFLGIELPVEVKNHIAQSVAPMQKDLKGWENPHDYHMTLLFIGETPEEDIPRIIMGIKEIIFPPFTITLRSLVFFPRRVMYLSCDPCYELMNLRKRIQTLYPEYARAQEKDFIPHITIKRYQRYEVADLKIKMLDFPFVPVKVRVDHLALFKSERDENNLKYHVLERS